MYDAIILLRKLTHPMGLHQPYLTMWHKALNRSQLHGVAELRKEVEHKQLQQRGCPVSLGAATSPGTQPIPTWMFGRLKNWNSAKNRPTSLVDFNYSDFWPSSTSPGELGVGLLHHQANSVSNSSNELGCHPPWSFQQAVEREALPILKVRDHQNSKTFVNWPFLQHWLLLLFYVFASKIDRLWMDMVDSRHETYNFCFPNRTQ